VTPRACALLAGLALAGGCGGEPERAPPSERVVDSARDGDTILLTDGRRVRLLQVDAPELGVECWGDEAAALLGRLVAPGTTVSLEADPKLDRVDRHGRLLRYVHVGKTNVNVELVRRGGAAPYFYRGIQGRYGRVLLRAARAAAAKPLGLWAACPGTRLRPTRAIASGRP
jgi:micrococcal nuclease